MTTYLEDKINKVAADDRLTPQIVQELIASIKLETGITIRSRTVWETYALMHARKRLWSEEKVNALNRRQNDGRFHPYTCPGDRPECEGRRNLIATKDGWVCRCGEYKQDWAHG